MRAMNAVTGMPILTRLLCTGMQKMAVKNNIAFVNSKILDPICQLLKSQGVRKGDRVSGLLPRTPELIITILATWRIGAVYQPLFTAFGPKAIEHRIQLAQSKLVVTDLANREKLSEISNCPAIVTVQAELHTQNYPQDFDFWRELNRQTETVELEMLSINDPFCLCLPRAPQGQLNH